MLITLRLAWLKPGAPARRAFRLPGAWDSAAEYLRRLARFGPAEIAGGVPGAGPPVWICDRGRGARALSSEELAERLGAAEAAGVRALEILVGGPDGFAAGELERLKPALRWSFGPLTLPHELAAVVAAEQLYRARTILKGAPYHLGH